jgi:pSer/pThr/pTyr-binding forkhead associated (FHA) protein
LSAAARVIGPKLALLDDDGSVMRTVTLDRAETVIGRADADLVFADDVFLSPIHAQFTWREGQLSVRDLGSRNGTWLFVEQPVRLTDGDVMLIGSQLVRFRRLGYPGPHPPEADQTRRLGSLIPTADVAVLAQLRGDGSTRDTLHLSPGRSVKVGRVEGDWVFPYDQTMSSRHAEVVSVDGDFYLQDQGSRNGVALSVRGERAVIAGQRVLMGDQLFRVESL